MTDPDLVAKKLAFVETCLADLRSHAVPDLARAGVVHQRFVLHTLQLAIQSALDVASHVVSDERLGEPETNRQLFALLAAAGRLDAPLAERLQAMAGFRNVVVHGYQDVDLALVELILRDHLGDLATFVATMRQRLASGSET